MEFNMRFYEIETQLKETASSGSTSASSIAVVPGTLGAGFDNDHSKSIYQSSKKKTVPLIRRFKNKSLK